MQIGGFWIERHINIIPHFSIKMMSYDKEEQIEELEVYFMPEECRVLEKGKQMSCINSYHSVQKCWEFPIGNGSPRSTAGGRRG